MMPTIDADEASWPPTLTPEAVVRTLFAWCTMLVASQSTRCCTASSTSSDDGVAIRRRPSRCVWHLAGEFKANGDRRGRNDR